MRNKEDLAALECPQKFKRLGDFSKYYRQEKRAPFLTVFVGGNHEASNYLRELYYGGFAAENIYFMGASTVIRVTKGEESVTIGGVSGIEKEYDARKGYYEEWPCVHNPKYLRSIYHIREFEIAKLNQFSKQIDIFVSHEWPTIATSLSHPKDRNI